MWKTLVVVLGGVAVLWGQPAITRDGPFWVRTITGSEDLAGATRLEITSAGPVTVTGSGQSNVTYSLRVKVKAGNEAEAARRLDEFRLAPSRSNGKLTLMLSPASGSGELSVSAPRGLADIRLATTEGDLAAENLDGTVRAETAGGNVRAANIKGELSAHTGGGDITLGDISGGVRCLTGGGRIKGGVIKGAGVFETGGGDIELQQVDGAVRATTGGGGIRIGKAGAGVTATTGGGPIEIGSARGMVVTRNSGGPVKVGAATGIRCENGAGAVRLENVSGSLRVSTAFGNIIAQLLAGRALADSSLTTANGDVTVMIPSDVGVTIQARNGSSDSLRRIMTEFPALQVRMAGSQVVAEGPVNGGGPVLRIASTGGTIFIKRQ